MTPLLINLITNWSGGKGLTRDGCLMEALFTAWGHHTTRVQYTAARSASRADLNLFLETLRPEAFPMAPRNVWVPNPEWARPEDLALLPQLDRVWCKTQEAYRLLLAHTDRAVYVGFESEDRYDPSVPRVRAVLHVAGNTILKGTTAVVEAWERAPRGTLPPLTIVGDVLPPRAIPGVTWVGSESDAEVRRLQNRCQVHLCPSETEGWGHTIHEGLSVGARVLVTDAPPMNESRGVDGMWLPARAMNRRALATLYHVRPGHILQAINGAGPWNDAPDRGRDIRAWWHEDRAAFRTRLKEVLG